MSEFNLVTRRQAKPVRSEHKTAPLSRVTAKKPVQRLRDEQDILPPLFGVNERKTRERLAKLASIPLREHPNIDSHSLNQWMATHGHLLKKALDPNSRNKYHRIFSMLDVDGSGSVIAFSIVNPLTPLCSSLSIDELHEAMKSLGLTITTKQLQQLCQSLNRDFTGELSRDEFVYGLAEERAAHADVSTRSQDAPSIADDEWDRLYELISSDHRRRRDPVLSSASDDSGDTILPFDYWVPAYHRRQQLNRVIERFGSETNAPTATSPTAKLRVNTNAAAFDHPTDEDRSPSLQYRWTQIRLKSKARAAARKHEAGRSLPSVPAVASIVVPSVPAPVTAPPTDSRDVIDSRVFAADLKMFDPTLRSTASQVRVDRVTLPPTRLRSEVKSQLSITSATPTRDEA